MNESKKPLPPPTLEEEVVGWLQVLGLGGLAFAFIVIGQSDFFTWIGVVWSALCVWWVIDWIRAGLFTSVAGNVRYRYSGALFLIGIGINILEIESKSFSALWAPLEFAGAGILFLGPAIDIARAIWRYAARRRAD